MSSCGLIPSDFATLASSCRLYLYSFTLPVEPHLRILLNLQGHSISSLDFLTPHTNFSLY